MPEHLNKNSNSNITNCSCCLGTTGRIIHKNMTSIYSSDKWSLFECSSCGNIFTLPVPGKELLNKIYSTTYLYPIHKLVINEKRMRARSLAAYIKKNFPSKTHPTLLEAGCMYGYLLNELKDEYKTKGIEIGHEAVNYCRTNGLDVSDTSIEDYLQQSTDKFDIIILSHVFEHLLNPDGILEQLNSRLNPGGKIILCIPNSSSICRNFFGRNWGWWQVPVHINHFREKSLRKMAERKNIRVETVRYRGGDSLMLLLNFINLFGFRKKDGDTSRTGYMEKIIIRIFTTFLRYWYYLGNEELTIVFSK